MVTNDFLKAAQRKASNSAKMKRKFSCCLRVIQGHSGGIPVEPELMDYALIFHKWKKYVFHRELSWNFQSILGHGLFLGGEEKDKARQAVFPTPTNLFGNDLEEEAPHDDCTIPQKASYVTKWKGNQDAAH